MVLNPRMHSTSFTQIYSRESKKTVMCKKLRSTSAMEISTYNRFNCLLGASYQLSYAQSSHTGNFGACWSAKVKTAPLDNLCILKIIYKLFFKIFYLYISRTLYCVCIVPTSAHTEKNHVYTMFTISMWWCSKNKSSLGIRLQVQLYMCDDAPKNFLWVKYIMFIRIFLLVFDTLPRRIKPGST
jgi:hypothetical protein